MLDLNHPLLEYLLMFVIILVGCGLVVGLWALVQIVKRGLKILDEHTKKKEDKT